MTQKLVNLKIKLLPIMVMINILLLKLMAQNFASRLAQANLANISDIANFVKKIDFDDKLKTLNKNVTSNKTKHVIVQNELNKLSEKVRAYQQKN